MLLVYKTNNLKKLPEKGQPYSLVLIKFFLMHHLLQKFIATLQAN